MLRIVLLVSGKGVVDEEKHWASATVSSEKVRAARYKHPTADGQADNFRGSWTKTPTGRRRMKPRRIILSSSVPRRTSRRLRICLRRTCCSYRYTKQHNIYYCSSVLRSACRCSLLYA